MAGIVTFLMVSLAIAALSPSIVIQSHASSFVLNTSESEYSYGESIIVHGNVGRIVENQTLDIKIQSTTTSGTIYDARNVTISENGSFNQSFTLSKEDKEGQYFAYAHYGDQFTKVEFFFYLTDNERTFHPLALTSSFNGTEYTIYGRSSEGIDVQELSISQHGIGMDIEAADDGVIELTLPKDVIDGISYVGIAREDTVESFPFEVLASNTTHSVLRFPVPEDTFGVEIQGSYMIPEFGSLSVVIAAMSIATVLVMMSRSNRKAAV